MRDILFQKRHDVKSFIQRYIIWL